MGGSDGAAPSADQHAGWAPTAMGNAGSGGAQPSPAVGAAADYDEAYRHLSQLQLDGDENQQPGTHTATAAPMADARDAGRRFGLHPFFVPTGDAPGGSLPFSLSALGE